MSFSHQELLAKSNSWPEGKGTCTDAAAGFHSRLRSLVLKEVELCVLKSPLDRWVGVYSRGTAGAGGTLSKKAGPELWGHGGKQKTGTREASAALNSPGLIHLPSPTELGSLSFLPSPSMVSISIV